MRAFRIASFLIGLAAAATISWITFGCTSCRAQGYFAPHSSTNLMLGSCLCLGSSGSAVAFPCQPGALTCVAESALLTRYDLLTARAKSLVTFVQAAQVKRKERFDADLAKDAADFHFRAERYGDFLALFVERSGKRSVSAFKLPGRSQIVLTDGRAPDMVGREWFGVGHAYSAAPPYVDTLWFTNVDLPPPDDIKDFYADPCLPVEVPVEGIARPPVDDVLTFDGTRPGLSDPQTSPAEQCNRRSGTTIYTSAIYGSPQGPLIPPLHVPAGQGQAIFDMIMQAIKVGAP